MTTVSMDNYVKFKNRNPVIGLRGKVIGDPIAWPQPHGLGAGTWHRWGLHQNCRWNRHGFLWGTVYHTCLWVYKYFFTSHSSLSVSLWVPSLLSDLLECSQTQSLILDSFLSYTHSHSNPPILVASSVTYTLTISNIFTSKYLLWIPGVYIQLTYTATTYLEFELYPKLSVLTHSHLFLIIPSSSFLLWVLSGPYIFSLALS
jgi:hypothetical protein